MLRARIDRGRCIGAGNCITLAPTAFDWLRGELAKSEVLDVTSVDEELLRAAAFSCPTEAITIDDVNELLPWQLRGAAATAPRRVLKTFMFTDIVRSTNLVEALGDEAWESLIQWHDQALRGFFAAHHGEEVSATGDGFFVGFDGPLEATACAIAIQRGLAEHRKRNGFAPQVRIGIHASGAMEVGGTYRGMGVHEAARIAAVAGAGEIVASTATTAGLAIRTSNPRAAELKGVSQPIDVLTVEWH
jgi:class 3 adenylate cyclase